jgi:hypothetical protein
VIALTNIQWVGVIWTGVVAGFVVFCWRAARYRTVCDLEADRRRWERFDELRAKWSTEVDQ